MPGLMAPLVLFWGEQITGIDVDLADSGRWVADVSPRPIFFLHSENDDYVGGECGHMLYDAAAEPKVEPWFVAECAHADFENCFPEEYETRVTAFYDQYLLDQ